MRRILLCLCIVLFSASLPVWAAVFPVRQLPLASGYNLLIGTWQGRNGQTMRISLQEIDGQPYTVTAVTTNGMVTIVQIMLSHSGTMFSLTFPNGNLQYVMRNNVTTGRFADAMDFTMKHRFSH